MVFGRKLGEENGTLTNGVSAFLRKDIREVVTLSPRREGPARKRPHAEQEVRLQQIPDLRVP